MSEAIRSEQRRTSARVALTLVAASLATVLVLSGGSIGAISFAQPTATAAGEIEFVNPNEATSTEVSAKEDEGSAYHLVAWVDQVPNDPTVQFEYQSGSENPVEIEDDAAQVGDDTFEASWTNLPTDDEYTLRVVMFSGAQFVDEDELTIQVNDESDDDPTPVPEQEEQGETVEITTPGNGDPMGFFENAEGNGVGVLQVSFSEDTETISAYYAISSPGTDPEFTECNEGEDAEDAEDGVRCTLEEGDDPEDVTAVAAVASNATDFITPGPPPEEGTPTDAADAHRTDGYEQFATSLELDVAGGGNVDPASCSPLVVGTVLDQNDDTVAGANVDVHAQGPSDNLLFGSSAATEEEDGTSEFDAPNESHEGDDEENARDCDANDNTGGSQASHETPDDDVKHIESTDGTGDDGGFRFKLFHPEANTEGGTQITAWADVDEEDQFCSEEPSGNASLGWDAAPPSASGLPPDETECTVPGPTPTEPTPTDTGTGSPSPTETSPSPEPTETDEPTTTRVASNVSIRYGNKRFKGSVGASRRRCQRGRKIVIKKRIRRGRNKTVARNRTNRAGNYRSRRKGRAKGRFFAIAQRKVIIQGDGDRLICRRDRSPTIRVRRGRRGR